MKPKTCYWVAALTVSMSIAVRVQAASTVQFTASVYTVPESGGPAALPVQRTGDTQTEVSVEYATADGTATNGSKYTAVSGTIVFSAGEITKTIVVPVLDNRLVEGSQNFRINLSDPAGGAVLGSRTNAIVTITDNDVGIQFQFATYPIAEDAGAVVIGIVRGDDSVLPVSVQFATTDLSATNGVDYIGATNTLSFAPQERLKLVPVPIMNNRFKQTNRTFRVTLANPTGITLDSQKAATVTILDNDSGFQFEFASYAVAEDAGVVRIAVLRGADETNSPVTVDFNTADVTANNGLNYSGTTNTLSFAAGEKIKFVTVPILSDGVSQAGKSFRISLGNPTGGAVLGPRNTAAVSILDSDPGIGFELAGYSVWENTGDITLTVLRGNSTALGLVTADYATSDLSAKAGLDYRAISGTLTFAQNETVKAITIPILRNGLVTNNSSFRVTLSNVTGGVALGRANTSVNIMNAPELGTFRAVAPPFDAALAIRREGAISILTWSGGGQLQRADRPTGPWHMLTNASSPYAVHSALSTTFYRVSQPRTVNLYIPSTYDGQTPAPLVILLHGYSLDGVEQERYMHLRPLAEARGFLYCYPDGTLDTGGINFWNGTDASADILNTKTDDAGYLRALIEEIASHFLVDRKRVHLIGLSNGAFMAYRMACQSADLIAGIASQAGATFLDPSRCAPSEPVNILHIHGTADLNVPYAGGAFRADVLSPSNKPPFPGALQTVQFWAGYNRASDPLTESGPSMDLDLSLPGLDTVITRYVNSPAGGAVELWTINGGYHVPTLSPEFSPRIIEWLLVHPKP